MNKTTLFLFRLIILYEICWGARAWFTWWTSSDALLAYLALIVIVFIADVYRRSNHIHLTNSSFIYMAFLCYIIGFLFSSHFAIFGVARSIFALYPMWILLSDTPERTKGHLGFVAKVLSVILILGIVEYLLFMAMPFLGPIIQYAESDNYVYLNFGFYIRNIGEYTMHTGGVEGFQRFNSVFLEPGYLASMLIFLLYALRFDLSKRENRIILYTIFLSLSLAGYVLMIIAYVFHRLMRKQSIMFIFAVPVVMLLFYVFAINYRGGDNYLNSLIVERLMPDEDRGISGNNRTSDKTREYFYRGLLNGDSFWGLGQERVERINGGKLTGFDHNSINGTGAIYYFVVNGIIAALFYLLFYIMVGRFSRARPYSTFFIILIMICFIQASYPDSKSWIYPFILGLKNYQNDYKRKRQAVHNLLTINA